MTRETTQATGLTKQAQAEFQRLAGALSPENLSCDGELPRAQVKQRYAQLKKEWRELEVMVGRTVTESDVWTWERQQ